MSNLIYLVALAAFVWLVYDVVTNQKSMSTGKKVLWIVFGFFFSIIAAIVYYLTVKQK
ncbi:PLDc N-terminal domain-containing protein [Labilibacter marinus]|uniref:PLDc N-terminal domain-containing protein n=1 Tax=Labilibacter marinus TaxID=1477105 RepID=UPI00094F5BD5|nr:PLDc N-terminal domain-containing protein [Labilibacter marinus]